MNSRTIEFVAEIPVGAGEWVLIDTFDVWHFLELESEVYTERKHRSTGTLEGYHRYD